MIESIARDRDAVHGTSAVTTAAGYCSAIVSDPSPPSNVERQR